MRQTSHAFQLRVDGLAPSGQRDERGFLAAIALVTLQAGDPLSDRLGAAGRPLDDLGVGRHLRAATRRRPSAAYVVPISAGVRLIAGEYHRATSMQSDIRASAVSWTSSTEN